MKIALISPYTTISSYGLRTVSAALKRDGHDVKLIFLPNRFTRPYSEDALRELAELTKDVRLVGISVMTNYFDNAAALTRALKQGGSAPVLWGGIHPTIRPEECLEHADMVCLGEGEETIVELAAKMRAGGNYLDTRGMWFNDKGRTVKNALPPLIHDLDSVPYPDYDNATHYLLHDGHIRPMDLDLLRLYMRGDYLAHPSRGCPSGCTYCCNNTLNRLYPGQSPFRKRSVDNVIGELAEMRAKLPFISHITFDDDAFFFYSDADLARFAGEYRRLIGLPLEIRGGHPVTVTRGKLELLVAAGLTNLKVGIETGGERTKKLYGRSYSNLQVEACVNLIHEFRANIPLPRYDIIVSNPWETDEDSLETLLLLAKFPVPFELSLFRLAFYPGTELHDKAVRDGLLKDEREEVYRKSFNVAIDGTSGKLLDEPYINDLFYLLHVYASHGLSIPAPALRLLADRKGRPVRSRLLYFFMRQKAGLLLKRDVVRRAFAEAEEGSAVNGNYALD